MPTRVYRPRFFTPLIHIFFWMLLFFLPHIVRVASTGLRFSESIQNRLILNNLILIGFFYLNAYILYPCIYKKKGLLLYSATVIALIVLFINSISFLERSFFPIKRSAVVDKTYSEKTSTTRREKSPRHRSSFFYFSLLPYIFIVGTSISYRIVIDYNKEEEVRKAKENETLKTELSFLRSQVSPHFMFNVLNTLVSMARKKSDLMEPSLIKLSALMRYMLYESNEERIALSREVEYLKSFIDLQLLRFGDDIDIRMDIDTGLEDYEIEPMLLISFVENAFKHGIGMIEKPFIRIKLSIDKQLHELSFVVENSVLPEGDTKDKSSGIGLNNMRRRLELLYRDNYVLETSRKEDRFVSRLQLQLR